MTELTEIFRAAGYSLVADGDVLAHIAQAMNRVCYRNLVPGADKVLHEVSMPLARGDILFFKPTHEDNLSAAHEAVSSGRRLVRLPEEGQLWATSEGRRAVAEVLAAVRHEDFEGDVAVEAMRAAVRVAEEDGSSVRITRADVDECARLEEDRIREMISAMRTASAITMSTLAWSAAA